MIKFFQRNQINDDRWNGIISSSKHETIYPYTWYLDACSDTWGAFIMNDYDCIMPVVYKSKLGLKYIYQPVYCQQLGVVSSKRVDSEIARMFLHSLKKTFKLGDYSFNEGNVLGEEQGFEITDSNNYVLEMQSSYDELFKKYSENCRRNVKRAYKSNIDFTDKISISEMIELKQSNAVKSWSDEHNSYTLNLYTQLEKLGKIKIFGAREGNELIAGAIFGFSNERAVFLLSASNDRGKELRGMFLVLDTFIQMHAGEINMLDFEGSNISSIARFFQGFGSKPRIYQRISFQNKTSKFIKKLRSV